jgi:hypothetical protein
MIELSLEITWLIQGGYKPLAASLPEEDEDFYDECDDFPYNPCEKLYC